MRLLRTEGAIHHGGVLAPFNDFLHRALLGPPPLPSPPRIHASRPCSSGTLAAHTWRCPMQLLLHLFINCVMTPPPP
jgi:hypothetical protein